MGSRFSIEAYGYSEKEAMESLRLLLLDKYNTEIHTDTKGCYSLRTNGDQWYIYLEKRSKRKIIYYRAFMK